MLATVSMQAQKISHIEILLSGKSFTRRKIRLKSHKRVSASFVTLLVAKNASNMSKSTYFTGQLVYSQVIKLLDKAVESTGKCKIRLFFCRTLLLVFQTLVFAWVYC